jgi:hypothetical protein
VIASGAIVVSCTLADGYQTLTITEEKLETYAAFGQCSDDLVAINDYTFESLELADQNFSLTNNMSTVVMIIDLVLLIVVTTYWSVKCCKGKKE